MEVSDGIENEDESKAAVNQAQQRTNTKSKSSSRILWRSHRCCCHVKQRPIPTLLWKRNSVSAHWEVHFD